MFEKEGGGGLRDVMDGFFFFFGVFLCLFFLVGFSVNTQGGLITRGKHKCELASCFFVELTVVGL